MLEWAFPWGWALLPLPFAVYWLAPPYRERQESIQVPFFRKLVELSGERPGRGAVILQRVWLQRVLLAITWVLAVCALAGPQWIGPPITQQKSARDLMIAADLSGSMETRDVPGAGGTMLTRLDAVKQVLGEFVGQRRHDRLGLILFGDAAFLQAPFTEDHDTWLELLNEAQIGMAGQSTMFGDAIGLALKLFAGSESRNKVLIVLTDGNDTGSKVPPVDAAKVAAADGIRIYAIAIGDPATSGEEALDTDTLQRIAELTHGAYYQALDRAALLRAYAAINALEPEAFDTLSYRPRRSLFHYPLAGIAALYMPFHFSVAVMGLWRRRRERHA